MTATEGQLCRVSWTVQVEGCATGPLSDITITTNNHNIPDVLDANTAARIGVLTTAHRQPVAGSQSVETKKVTETVQRAQRVQTRSH